MKATTPILNVPIGESLGTNNEYIEDGMYIFDVLDYEYKQTKRGEPLLIFRTKLDNNKIYNIPFILTSSAISRLCEFLVALGVKVRGIPVLLSDVIDDVIGKTAMCYISNRLAIRFLFIQDLLCEDKEEHRMFVDYYEKFINEYIEKGNRNNMLFRAVLAGIASNRNIDVLVNRALELGLSENEIRTTINSAYKIDNCNKNIYKLWYQPVTKLHYINEIGDVYDSSSLYKQFVDQINTMFKQDEYILIATLDKDTADDKRYSYNVYTFSELLDPEFTVPENAVVMINPVSSKKATGKIDDVSSYRYVLVECDDMPIDKQYEFWMKTELPVDLLVYSGNKSLHAYIRVDAENYEDWHNRVDVVKKYLSIRKFNYDKTLIHVGAKGRLAGCYRNSVPQCIVAKKLGINIDEFMKRYDKNNELPTIMSFSQMRNHIINNSPPPILIDGILRKASTMVIGGEPKVGKTMILLNLLCALASDGYWLGRKVSRAKVLYINMEVDEYILYERLSHILDKYENVDDSLMYFMHLRGCELGFEDLFRYIENNILQIGGVDVVIVDPIYKLFAGDENSAKEVSKLVSMIDRFFVNNGITFIFAHHLNKSSSDKVFVPLINRLSGSGVFTRYPEAIMNVSRYGENCVRIDYYLRCFEQPSAEKYIFEYPLYRRMDNEESKIKSCSIANSEGLSGTEQGCSHG